MSGENGWSEYSKLVLKELETLSRGIEGLNDEIQSLQRDITELRSREDKVDKQRVDEVASPTQMKIWIKEVERLKTFKTKAVTVFLVAQGLMGVALALSSFFK